MATHTLRSDLKPILAYAADFARWLSAHRGAVTMACLLAFAVPVTFFPGAVSVMRTPTAADIAALTAWLALFGITLSCSLLSLGYVAQRLEGRYAGVWSLVGASTAAALAEFTNGRADILLEQGVVQSSLGMHAYGFVSALIMGLLFFAHLHRSRARERAAERLSAAQSAQREAHRRVAQARLQALQARIDPQLLFEMLDAIRRAYQEDVTRAERLLDELVDFLRAALPRLRNASSTVQREARLARSYAELRALAADTAIDISFNVPSSIADARFPPGVLLPLIDTALRVRVGACALEAACSGNGCELLVTLPARPAREALARVRSLLSDLYGAFADLAIDEILGAVRITIKVPYEHD
jgi:hypothetical protein